MGASKRALGPVVWILVSIVAAVPVHSAGFAIFEQGAKPMGMAGAFTAQADDPSAMFHNVGGLAFLGDERQFQAGINLISLGDSDFQGAAPFPGPTQSATQADNLLITPHFYWVEPINETFTFGLGVNAPFGLTTEWDDPDNFAGRFLNEKAELKVVDINPSVGIRVNDEFGIGIGLVLRTSDLELDRRAAAINPNTGFAEEVSKVNLASDLDFGFGVNIGFRQVISDLFTWGLTYRSEVEIEYSGDGLLTQQLTGDPVFDAIVAGTFPFDTSLPLETEITFPGFASLGLGFAVSDTIYVEGDINWTGWSSFDNVPIIFTTVPSLSTDLPQGWDNALQVRSGLRWTRSDTAQWRFGLYWDESPQPDEGVSPLLPDADRIGYTVGYGHAGEKYDIDAYVLFVDFDDRTTLTNRDNFNGTYQTTVLLAGVTLGW